MWLGEPTSAPVIVIRSSWDRMRAMPKSASLTAGLPPSSAIMTFSGFRIPVDDPRGMGVRECIGERHAHQGPALREGNPGFVGEGAKRSTVDELGDEPALLRAVAGVVEDLHDARVGKASHRPSLAGEPGSRLCLGRQVRVKDLDRDFPIERGVPAPVDDRHSTGSHLFEEFVAVDPSNQGTPLRKRHPDPMAR